MAQGVFAQGHQLADLWWSGGQAHPVLDVALVLADLLGELPQRVAQVGHLAEHRRLLQGRDILPLQVLDDRHLQGGLLVELGNDGGDRFALRHSRGAPPALAGDQLVLAPDRTDEDRLQDAVLADRIGQLGE